MSRTSPAPSEPAEILFETNEIATPRVAQTAAETSKLEFELLIALKLRSKTPVTAMMCEICRTRRCVYASIKDCTSKPEHKTAKHNRNSNSENRENIKSLRIAPIMQLVVTKIRAEGRVAESTFVIKDFATSPRLKPIIAPNKRVSARLKMTSTLALTRSECRSFLWGE